MDILNPIFSAQITKTILDFLHTSQAQSALFIIKIVFGVFSGLLLVIIIYTVVRSGYFKWLFIQDLFELLTHRAYGQKKIVRQWENITKRLEKASESEYKLAVIEAETVLDEVLTRMGFAGQSIGERLEKIKKEQLPSFDEVLEAHKTRNNIVHDPDFRLTLDQAKKTLDIYEKALKELEIF